MDSTLSVNAPKVTKMLPADYAAIVSDYESGLSAQAVAVKRSVGEWSVRRVLARMDVSIRPRWCKSRQYRLDETFFQTIDTEEKAYWLGFLYADGAVYSNAKGYMFHLTLANKDLAMVEAFRVSLKTDIPIHHFEKRKQSGLFVWSKRLYQDLVRLGCGPCKSMTLQWPKDDQVPPHLLRHFVRGFFDGDGTVTFNRKNTRVEVKIISSLAFCQAYDQFLRSVIGDETRYHGVICLSKVGNLPYSTVGFGTYKAVTDMYAFLYTGATLYLERKKRVFERYFDHKTEMTAGRSRCRDYDHVILTGEKGDVITLRNVKAEAALHGLRSGGVYDLINGHSLSHKGYRLTSWQRAD